MTVEDVEESEEVVVMEEDVDDEDSTVVVDHDDIKEEEDSLDDDIKEEEEEEQDDDQESVSLVHDEGKEGDDVEVEEEEVTQHEEEMEDVTDDLSSVERSRSSDISDVSADEESISSSNDSVEHVEEDGDEESLGTSLQSAGRQLSIESVKTLGKIERLKEAYEHMQEEAEQIHRLTDEGDLESVAKAKNQLAQILGNIEKLQFNQLDAVMTTHLDSGKIVAKANRRELNESLDDLQDFVSTLYNRYAAATSSAVSSPPPSPTPQTSHSSNVNEKSDVDSNVGEPTTILGGPDSTEKVENEVHGSSEQLNFTKDERHSVNNVMRYMDILRQDEEIRKTLETRSVEEVTHSIYLAMSMMKKKQEQKENEECVGVESSQDVDSHVDETTAGVESHDSSNEFEVSTAQTNHSGDEQLSHDEVQRTVNDEEQQSVKDEGQCSANDKELHSFNDEEKRSANEEEQQTEDKSTSEKIQQQEQVQQPLESRSVEDVAHALFLALLMKNQEQIRRQKAKEGHAKRAAMVRQYKYQQERDRLRRQQALLQQEANRQQQIELLRRRQYHQQLLEKQRRQEEYCRRIQQQQMMERQLQQIPFHFGLRVPRRPVESRLFDRFFF